MRLLPLRGDFGRALLAWRKILRFRETAVGRSAGTSGSAPAPPPSAAAALAIVAPVAAAFTTPLIGPRLCSSLGGSHLDRSCHRLRGPIGNIFYLFFNLGRDGYRRALQFEDLFLNSGDNLVVFLVVFKENGINLTTEKS